MSTIVTIDIGRVPYRRLANKFNGAGDSVGTAKAVGITAPASVTGSSTGIDIAMGVVPKSGVVSFLSDGATDDWTIYFWSDQYKQVAPSTKGWYLGAESAALNTKNVLQHSICSFKGPVGAPFFLKRASSVADNCLISAEEHPANRNTA